MQPDRRSRASLRTHVFALTLSFVAGGCASLDFKRTTETSGTFRSSGLAMTILSADLPKEALQIARENASDANLANMVVKEVVVVPYFGPLDFLLDIFSIRYARISGTWGFDQP